jgi:hypothetical protein
MSRFGSIVRGLCVAAVIAAASSGDGLAGPFADFERELASAYGPYKAALFQTNQKDKSGTEKSLAAFEAQWGQLMKAYRASPPPQYSDDAAWPQTIAAVEKLIAAAKAETEKGDLAKAHDVLEGVRDQLGSLRLRNGVVVFSDRVDAFHEHMEHVLGAKYAGADGAATLREDSAVLVHLAGLLEKNAPVGLVDGPGIDPEPPRRRPFAEPLDLNRVANLQIVVHVKHPPPSAERGTGLPVAGLLLRRNRPTRLLH